MYCRIVANGCTAWLMLRFGKLPIVKQCDLKTIVVKPPEKSHGGVWIDGSYFGVDPPSSDILSMLLYMNKRKTSASAVA
jgi:hypothetical protein